MATEKGSTLSQSICVSDVVRYLKLETNKTKIFGQKHGDEKVVVTKFLLGPEQLGYRHVSRHGSVSG